MIEIIAYNDWQVRLIRSSRKTLSLEIDQHGLKARAPMRMRERTILEFIHHKENWIKRHLANIKPKPSKIALDDGALLPFRNEFYRLAIQPNRRSKVRIKDGQIFLPLIGSQLDNPAAARAKLIRWYKHQALEALQKIVAQNLSAMQLKKPNSIKVREYARRWGSCDHRGDLSFNWRIILAPDNVIQYVVIHELAHIIEFNHSRQFWSIVSQQMPDWKQQQHWLSEHGAELYTI